MENIATVREIIEQFGNYRTVVKNFHSRRRRGEMLGVSGRGRIVEQPAFRNEIRIERHVFVVFHLVRAAASTTNQLKYRLRSYYTERHVFVVFHLVRAAASTTNQLKYRLRSYYTERHVFVVFHLVRAAASTTNQLKYRLRSYYTEIIGLGESSRSSCSTRASRSCYMSFSNFPPRPIISV